MPKTYTVKEVATILGFSTNSIYTFLKEKRIKGVRVGRGRFRIPETELARVLHLSKNPSTTLATQPAAPQQVSVSIDALPGGPIDSVIASSNVVSFIGKNWPVPDIFDWMIGVGAVVSGVGLFLFNQTYQSSVAAKFVANIPYIRLLLITAGLGVLISSIMHKAQGWRPFFQIVLGITGIFNAWALFRGGDINGMFVYGSLAIMVLLGAFVHLNGVVAVSSYLTVLAAGAPFIFYLGKDDLLIRTLYSYLDITPLIAVGISSVLVCVFLIGFWSGFRRGSLVFILCSFFASAGLIIAALHNASLVFWSRAFFLLILAVTVGFLPFFRNCGPSCSPRQRALLHSLFGLTTLIILSCVVVVGLLQKAVWDQNSLEFESKTKYAQEIISKSLDSVTSTLTIASKNPEIIGALEEGDVERLESLSKVMYEGNTFIRRIIFIDRDGQGVALYPHGTFDQIDLSFREYYRIVRDTKEPYISDIFTALVDGSNRKVFSVSVPVLNGDKEFIGVMSGSVDMLKLGGTLQSVAIGSRQENFTIVDKTGKIVIALEASDIGKPIPKDDLLWKGLRGATGVELARMRDGTLGMVTYAPLPPHDWAVTLGAPASRVYALSAMAIYVIFGVVVLVVTAILFWMIVLRVHITGPISQGASGP